MSNEQQKRVSEASEEAPQPLVLRPLQEDEEGPPQPARKHRLLADRVKRGRGLRQRTSRSSHAAEGHSGRDPIELIELSSRGRVEQLVQLRYGRMLASPFTFFRGTALLQAHDLHHTPRSGINTQICGDCHLMNFGGYASPERSLVFDINDFDETDPGPWEWDVKRLAASFAVAARHLGLSEGEVEEAVFEVARSYQQNMAKFATMSALEIWYHKTTMQDLMEMAATDEGRKVLSRIINKAESRTHEELLPKIANRKDGQWAITDTPPTIFHLFSESTLLKKDKDWRRLRDDAPKYRKEIYEQYLRTLLPYRRELLEQFRIHDVAFKVVGVGSVGTRCLIMLMTDDNDTPLFLQIKEAGPSVVSKYSPAKSRVRHQGQRVVDGQRKMQATSDMFLGWTTGPFGRHYYMRQLRDMKVAAEVETLDSVRLQGYARMCGLILARAHAKSGAVAPEIHGYLGKSDTFAKALVKYAKGYADIAERDYDLFRRACRSGRLQARTDEDFAYDLSMATK